ncbi:transposase [Planktothricoides raciborskii]|uniref:Transposase n=1 Tax=Planktothricoides raciborskii GIHE-MW2 TaxID=2792601 RepID=A0AAU8JIH6_9CYAN
MNKKICGADVCKAKIVAVFLDEKPENLKAFFSDTEKFQAYEFDLDQKNVTQWLAQGFSELVLEPTGINYSWLWAEIATQNGIRVRWADHKSTRHYRESHKLPDKNDKADALALAAIGWEFGEDDDYFLKYCHNDDLSFFRDAVLQLECIEAACTRLINRARQQLCREFPEVAFSNSKEATDGEIPLWAWLAGAERKLKIKSSTHDNKWAKSVGKAYGQEISDFTRFLAQQIRTLKLEEERILKDLKKRMRSPEFMPYQKVMTAFGFNVKLQALVIALCYPIDRFFTPKGFRAARAKFKQRLGFGRIEESYGDKKKTKVSGSALGREFVNHLISRTCGNSKKWVPKNHYQDRLLDYYNFTVKKWCGSPEAIKAKQDQEEKDKLMRDIKDQMGAKLSKEQMAQIEEIVRGKVKEVKVEKLTSNQAKKKWQRLINSRVAAKCVEMLWQALMDEIYPKA